MSYGETLCTIYIRSTILSMTKTRNGSTIGLNLTRFISSLTLPYCREQHKNALFNRYYGGCIRAFQIFLQKVKGLTSEMGLFAKNNLKNFQVYFFQETIISCVSPLSSCSNGTKMNLIGLVVSRL